MEDNTMPFLEEEESPKKQSKQSIPTYDIYNKIDTQKQKDFERVNREIKLKRIMSTIGIPCIAGAVAFVIGFGAMSMVKNKVDIPNLKGNILSTFTSESSSKDNKKPINSQVKSQEKTTTPDTKVIEETKKEMPKEQPKQESKPIVKEETVTTKTSPYINQISVKGFLQKGDTVYVTLKFGGKTYTKTAGETMDGVLRIDSIADKTVYLTDKNGLSFIIN